MKFIALKQHISLKRFSSAYIIVGEDAFLRKSATDRFFNLIEVMPELNLTILTAPSSEKAIIEAAEVLPLMTDYRIVAVYDFKGEIKKILSYLENPCPTTIILFVAESLTANFSKALKHIEPIECDRQDEEVIIRWIAQRVKQNGGEITDKAALLLTQYCARSMTRVSGETDKLCAYKGSEPIESKDVEFLVTPDLEVKIFSLSDALGAKNADKTATILKALLDSDSTITQIMGLMYAHFRRLLYSAISQDKSELGSLLGVKEYAVKKAREQAAKYSPKRLKLICDTFNRVDNDFKAGKLTDKMALDLFILQALNA